MVKVYEFLANGFEEIEALAPVDILRRGGIDIKTVSITGSQYAESSHGITIKADLTFEEAGSFGDADLLMLPGGMPGAANLKEHQGVREAMLQQFNSGKLVSAICAAPMVLGSLGIVKGKKATCYPGFQQYLTDATYTARLVEHDGNVITGEGPAATFPYAYSWNANWRFYNLTNIIIPNCNISWITLSLWQVVRVCVWAASCPSSLFPSQGSLFSCVP